MTKASADGTVGHSPVMTIGCRSMRFGKRNKAFRFRFNSDQPDDVREDIRKKYGYDGDLLELFSGNKGSAVHKWHHYIPLYDRYFHSFRGRKIRFLEIGVGEGGGLQMWRKYFGEEAVLFGIDKNPECHKCNGLVGQVRIGSQTDRAFLESVVREMGGVDIVLDDGSHHMRHLVETLKCLFPRLNEGGLYVVEDLHAAYWKKYGGGYRSPRNFFRFLRGVVDDMHHWYHRKGFRHALVGQHCSGIHIHDSMVVLEKNPVHPPVISKIG